MSPLKTPLLLAPPMDRLVVPLTLLMYRTRSVQRIDVLCVETTRIKRAVDRHVADAHAAAAQPERGSSVDGRAALAAQIAGECLDSSAGDNHLAGSTNGVGIGLGAGVVEQEGGVVRDVSGEGAVGGAAVADLERAVADRGAARVGLGSADGQRAEADLDATVHRPKVFF